MYTKEISEIIVDGDEAYQMARDFVKILSPHNLKKIWSSGNLGGRLIEKTAMIVPLKIEELPYAFEAQFDLGACSTMIYGKAFAPYLAMASDIREKIDTTQTVFLQGASYPCFADLSIQLDGVEFPNRRVVFFEDFGTEMTKDSLCTSTIKHIGTIAADLFEGKILIIDYKNQRLCGGRRNRRPRPCSRAQLCARPARRYRRTVRPGRGRCRLWPPQRA